MATQMRAATSHVPSIFHGARFVVCRKMYSPFKGIVLIVVKFLQPTFGNVQTYVNMTLELEPDFTSCGSELRLHSYEGVQTLFYKKHCILRNILIGNSNIWLLDESSTLMRTFS